MLIELTAETILKNIGTGQRVTLESGQVIDLPGQIANKIIEKGKARLIAGKPLQVPATCFECTEHKCHTCLHSCKVPLEIGKQYPPDHVFN